MLYGLVKCIESNYKGLSVLIYSIHVAFSITLIFFIGTRGALACMSLLRYLEVDIKDGFEDSVCFNGLFSDYYAAFRFYANRQTTMDCVDTHD